MSRSCATAASRRRFAPGRQVELVEERVDRVRLALHRTQHVQGLHVARALPDRHQRRLAVAARQARLLDVAVAALALQRLGRRAAGRACRSSTSGPGRPAGGTHRASASPAAASSLARARRRRRPGRGLGLQRQVGEHGGHRGLVGPGAGRTRRGARPSGSPRWCPGASPPSEPSTQSLPGAADHRHDRAHAAAGLADECARAALSKRTSAVGFERLPSLSLSRSMVQPFAAPSASRPPGAGHQQAAHALRGLGQDEQRVGLHRGDEPLLAGDAVARRRPARRRVVFGPHVRAAAASRSAPSRSARRCFCAAGSARGVVDARGHQRLPHLG